MLASLPSDPWFYAAGTIAVVLLGLSKGGFAGIGSLALPLLALTIGPIEAAAILLPILIVQDVVGVWAFRHHWDGRILAVMLPGAIAGIALGYWFAAEVSETGVLALLGAISILFAVHRLWTMRGHRMAASSHAPGWAGSLLGMASGFTSQIAHAGAPPFQIYVLPRNLPRDILVGTTAIFFAAVNWIKVPAYVALGQFTPAHLVASAALLPVATVSTFAGVWLVRRVPAERFYALIYALMILVGLKLLWDALA